MKFPKVLDVKKGPNEVTLLLYIANELDCFQGHFKEVPLLPGVVQLDWSIAYAMEYLGIEGDIEAVDTIKFLKAIQPKQTMLLRLRYQPEKAVLRFSYKEGETEYSAGKVIIR